MKDPSPKKARGPRLRTRLVAAFVLVALPGVVISIAAVSLFGDLIREEIDRRTTEVLEETERLLVDERQEIRQLVETAATSLEPFEELARNPDDEQLWRRLGPWASRKAASLRLDLLAVVIEGPDRTELVSSAHLPAAIGSAPPNLGPVEAGRTRTGFALEKVAGNPPEPAPALLAVHAPKIEGIQNGRVWIYGGRRLDHRLLGRVARMANARVSLKVPGRAADIHPRGVGPAPSEAAYPIPLKAINGGDGVVIDVAVHTRRLWEARGKLIFLSQVLVAAALAIALVAGAWLADRITQPIWALAQAAKRVGSGDLEVSVTARSNDEVGELVRVFNRMTEDLAEAQNRIQRAERVAAWREVARRLAHEIKNPLSPMRLGMENLRKAWTKQHPKLDEILEESTRSVLDEVQSLDRLVSAFSAFARLPAPEPVPTRPEDLLAQAARLYESNVRFDREAIEARTLPMVSADPEQISRCLLNLVKNAHEALENSSEGQIGLDAWTARNGNRSGVTLEVSDNGPGMDEKVRSKATSVYYTTKKTGTGLGLAIVQRTMEEHGGSMAIESNPGVGTKVRLWLPMARVDPPSA